MIAKTAAAGGPGLLPEVLAFSSSLAQDRALLREDLVGSLAHLTMLSRTGIMPKDAAAALRTGIVALWPKEGATADLPDEEDVHMAVEAVLARTVGAPSGLLHTARSRNNQVALDLKLHVRERCRVILDALGGLVGALAERAKSETETLIPSYTHRQRAQPISVAYWMAGHAAAFARDVEAFTYVFQQADSLPLGVGAIAGTTLPVDREITRELLGFSRITLNGLDTVGDRDFALDYAYAAARFLLHASRLATDMIDFSSAEFGFAKLNDEIACGSSMMPQKKNPDLFELVRGKSGPAVGDLVALLTTVKGLPGGYNRDLQEDRGPLLAIGPRVEGVIAALALALPRVRFQPERCLAALLEDATQATDLAEALVKKGIPFRTAYQAVGRLVKSCQEQGLALGAITLEGAQRIDAAFDADVMRAADVRTALGRKTSAGSTGTEPVKHQIRELEGIAARAKETAQRMPRLEALFASLKETSL